MIQNYSKSCTQWKWLSVGNQRTFLDQIKDPKCRSVTPWSKCPKYVLYRLHRKLFKAFEKITVTDVPSNSLAFEKDFFKKMFTKHFPKKPPFSTAKKKSLRKKASFQRGLHRGHAAPMGLTAFRFVTSWNCQSSTGGFQPAPCWDFRWIYINPEKRCHESYMKS